ncbi:creatininase family protein [Acidobacteria bacterium AB60]|nr:creatininase family protein [Acidobacteria bacterium AB60]
MRKLASFIGFFAITAPLTAQVLQFADLNTRDFLKLSKDKVVVIVPGGILEEHGPYLPSGTDGIFNARLADDLAKAVASRPGWTALLMPQIPLGAGAANELGRKYWFPGSCTVTPNTLRSIFMDIADQLGQLGFRWIVVVHGHGDPAHNRMLDQAGDYFHDTYGGEMVNLFGYLWAMDLKDFRSAEEQREDGLPEHATMAETSWILALKPRAVAPDYKSALPHSGKSIDELEQIASQKDWPGYFGAPALASSELGWKMYDQWVQRATELMNRILDGKDYRKLARYGDVYADDPGDAAAMSINRKLEAQHDAWLKKMASKP